MLLSNYHWRLRGYPAGDTKYCLWQVIKGMDVVDTLATLKSMTNSKPKEKVTINLLKSLKNYN